MDLDTLFTVTEYKTSVISIPWVKVRTETDDVDDDMLAYHEDNQSNPQLRRTDKYDMITIKVASSPAACTDYDLTGQVIWPVSNLLSHYLASSSAQPYIRHRTVVELGAGCGLPGLVAAAIGAKQVVLTDGNDVVLDLLQQNITSFLEQQQLQQQKPSNHPITTANQTIISSLPLVWGDRKSFQKVLQQVTYVQGRPQIDTILAADVVQWPSVIEPLLHTVKALLWHRATADASTPRHEEMVTTTSTTTTEAVETTPLPTNPSQTTTSNLHPNTSGVFLLGIVNRAESTYRYFFQFAKQLGFSYTKIQSEDWWITDEDNLENPSTNPPHDTSAHLLHFPPSCQESGGRRTELYQLQLVDLHQPPILLEEQGPDIFVGKGYEQTLVLPC